MTNTIEVEVCIVGLGPAGLGSALELARSSLGAHTICIEGGVTADARYCSILQNRACRKVEPCQVIAGIGGSSLLSGGKVSMYPAGRKMSAILGGDDNVKLALERAGEVFRNYVPLIPLKQVPQDIELGQEFYKRLGFDYRYYAAFLFHQNDVLRGYNRMIHDIISAKTPVLTNTVLRQIGESKGGYSLLASSSAGDVRISCEKIVLAMGRAGKGLMANLNKEFNLKGNTGKLEIGVRLEFPSALWPEIDSCHNDLKLHFNNARTFCVCKDGYLAPYRCEDFFLLEGHSTPETKTGYSNLGIAIRPDEDTAPGDEDLFSFVHSHTLMESRGKPIRQRLVDYLNDEPSPSDAKRDNCSVTFWEWGNVNRCFPKHIAVELREAVWTFVSKVLPKDSTKMVSVFGPSMDYFWMNFPLKAGFESHCRGIYIVGDSGGLFRGILQSFCSGIEAGKHITQS